MATDAVLVRYLTNAIVETIYKRSNNAWRFGISDGAGGMVMNQETGFPYKMVYPSSAGDYKDDVVVNPKQFPLPVGEKAGTPNEYVLDQYALLPQRVGDFDNLITNRNQVNDLNRNQIESLNEVMAEAAYLAYAPNNAHIVQTTGANVPLSEFYAGAPAANVKAPVYNDFLKVLKVMRDQNVPGSWYGLANSAMIYLLEQDADFKAFEQNTNRFTPASGALEIFGRWGINVFDRIDGVRYDAAFAPREFASAVLATDQPSIIFWTDQSVRYNDPWSKSYVNRDKAEYLGSIYNLTMASGWTKHRQVDQKGTVALVAVTN